MYPFCFFSPSQLEAFRLLWKQAISMDRFPVLCWAGGTSSLFGFEKQNSFFSFFLKRSLASMEINLHFP